MKGTPFTRVGVFLLALLPSLCTAAPRPLVTWRGTVVLSDGRTGTFVAHARLFTFRNSDSNPEYQGRYRCHGAGCPFRRGRIILEPMPIGLEIDHIRSLFFFRPSNQSQCGYFSTSLQSNFAVSGSFDCFGGYFTAKGSISLVGTRRR